MFDFRSFFNNFPYTDFHELNLDFILNKIGAIDGAVEEATEAATTATEAAGTAQTASFTAVDASQAAVSAKNSAVSAKFDAESARDAAQTAATNAESSATAASQRAAAALASQTAAESSKTAAEAARDAAQTARTGAQTARTGAEAARDAAQAARTGAETAETNAANSATAAANSAAAITFVRRSLGADADFDSVTDAGFYIFTTTANSVNPPGNLTNAYMFVINNPYSPLVCQIAYGGRSDAMNAVYVRQYYSNAWLPWRPLYFNVNHDKTTQNLTNNAINAQLTVLGGGAVKMLTMTTAKRAITAAEVVNIGTLTQAYRPAVAVNQKIWFTNSKHATLSIGTDGAVKLNCYTAIDSGDATPATVTFI